MIRIKELREEKGLTQCEVAVGIHTSQKNISRWENGQNEPSSSFIIKLADFFDVTADEVLGREVLQRTYQSTTTEQKLIYYYNLLPEDKRKMFLELLHSMLDK